MRDSRAIMTELDQRDLLVDARRCAIEFESTVEDICSQRPLARREAYAARYAFWRWLTEMYSFSLPRVGALFGVHHTTVLYGVRVAQGLPGKNPPRRAVA